MTMNSIRLLYEVVLDKAQEHFSYANTSEGGDMLCELAARFMRHRQPGGMSRIDIDSPEADCLKRSTTSSISYLSSPSSIFHEAEPAG